MDLQQSLREHIIQQYLNGKAPSNFNDDYDLIDDGTLDSLAIIGLISWLESQYQIEFGDNDIVPENFSSINTLTTFIQKQQ